MKVLVTYYSETGNTERLARAIYDGIERTEKEIIPLHEHPMVENYDVIFFGFPVQASSVPHTVEPYLRRIPEGKRIALFATHGCMRGGQLAMTAFYYAMSLSPKAKVIGTFGCQGKVKPDLLDKLVQKPEHKGWVQEARGAHGHPSEADLADGKEFARSMVTKAQSYDAPW